MPRRELGAAVGLLAFGLFAVTQAWRLRLGSIAAPGPGLVPLGLALALSLVGLALVVVALRTPAGPDVSAAGAGRGSLKVVGTLAALLVYALVLEPAGFRLATFALLLFFFKALQRQRWLVAVGGSAVIVAAMWLVFKVWIGVNLPAGPWRL